MRHTIRGALLDSVWKLSDLHCNDAALATLAKGSSSVLSGKVITAYTHRRVSAIGLWPWFDRVASADNPVERLSQGNMQGPWTLVDMAFPQILLCGFRMSLTK